MVYLLKMVIFYSKLLVYQRVYHTHGPLHIWVSNLRIYPGTFECFRNK